MCILRADSHCCIAETSTTNCNAIIFQFKKKLKKKTEGMKQKQKKKKKKKVLLCKSFVLKCCIYFITFSHSRNKSNIYQISAASCMGISESGCFYYSSLDHGTDLPFLLENSLQVQTMRQTLCSLLFSSWLHSEPLLIFLNKE